MFKILLGLKPKKGLKMLDFQAWEGPKVLKILDPRNSGGAKASQATPLIQALKGVQLIIKIWEFLALGDSLGHIQVLHKVLAPYIRPLRPPNEV